jgi:hypothetical protein
MAEKKLYEDHSSKRHNEATPRTYFAEASGILFEAKKTVARAREKADALINALRSAGFGYVAEEPSLLLLLNTLVEEVGGAICDVTNGLRKLDKDQ